MWMTCTNKSYDFAYTRDHTGTKRPLSSRDIRGGTAARRLLGRRCFPRKRCERLKPARTSTPSSRHSFCMCMSPEETVSKLKRGRPAHPRAGLEADPLVGNRAQKGPGVGIENHRVLPHLRHPARVGQAIAVCGLSAYFNENERPIAARWPVGLFKNGRRHKPIACPTSSSKLASPPPFAYDGRIVIQSRIAAATASGCSIVDICPLSGIIASLLPGIADAIC